MKWDDYLPATHSDGQPRGVLKRLRDLYSPQLDNRRDLIVYLPPSYHTSEQRYPVIYMHDGQNLFDPATSFAASWLAHERMDRLREHGVEAIIVGIPNMGDDRPKEYSPFDDPKHGPGCGSVYLDFLVDTVKPCIDADFRTSGEREHTGTIGASLGALISLYAFFARPRVFGFTGALSPALWYAERRMFDYISAASHLPGRIYLDVGGKEGKSTLRDIRLLRDRLVKLGYRSGKDLLYVMDRKGEHDENAWGRRLDRATHFLLRGTDRSSAASLP